MEKRHPRLFFKVKVLVTLLLLLLSDFSHVRLCATPQMAAHQAPLSLGFSSQEYWSGLPFPSPRHATSLQLCLTLCDPMDSSPPGSPVHGILQARILEWVAMPSSGDLPNPGIEPRSAALQANSLPTELPEKPIFLR